MEHGTYLPNAPAFFGDGVRPSEHSKQGGIDHCDLRHTVCHVIRRTGISGNMAALFSNEYYSTVGGTITCMIKCVVVSCYCTDK